MKFQFKAGDRVRVRRPANIHESPGWTPKMERHHDKIRLVRDVHHLNGGRCRVYLEDETIFTFHPNWLTLMPEEPKATLDLKKPLQTKDGRPVRLLGKLTSGEIVGAILNTSGNGDYEKPYMWTPDGKPAFVLTLWPGCYLVNVPEKPIERTGFLIIRRTEGESGGVCTQWVNELPATGVLAKMVLTIKEGDGMEGVL